MRKTMLLLMGSSALMVICTGCPLLPSAPPTGYVKTDDVVVDPVTMRWLSYRVRPYQQIAGSWQVDLSNPAPVGSVYTFGLDQVEATDERGEFSLTNARLNAGWNFSTIFSPPCYDNVHYDPIKVITTFTDDYTWLSSGAEQTAVIACEYFEPASDEAVNEHSQFMLGSPTPSSLTVASVSPVGSSPEPTLLLYNQNDDTPFSTTTASSVSSDGTSITFPFPHQSSGSVIPGDVYSYSVIDNSQSRPLNAGGGVLVVADSDTTTYSEPFGVDALSVVTSGTVCTPITIGPVTHTHCAVLATTTLHYPIVTEYEQGVVKYKGSLTSTGTTSPTTSIAVGSHPTVVRAYDTTTTTTATANGGSRNVAQASRAIVVNSGSNSMSILDLPSATTVATIAVGSQPVDVRISADNTKAYVVNYGAGTMSVISLTSNAVTNTINIGGHPTSISLDASGNAFIGNSGSITEVNLSTLAVSSTQVVSGGVNGLGFSTGTGQLLTSFEPTSSSSTVGAVAFKPASAFSQAGTLAAHSSASSDYANSALTPQLLWASQLANGISISNTFANNYAISVSGSQFTVSQLSSSAAWIQGVLPGVIRGVAVASDDSYAYLTVPDENMLVTIPIPSPPTTPSTPIIAP